MVAFVHGDTKSSKQIDFSTLHASQPEDPELVIQVTHIWTKHTGDIIQRMME